MGAFDGGAFDFIAFDVSWITTDDILDFNVYNTFNIGAMISVSRIKEIIFNMTKEVNR